MRKKTFLRSTRSGKIVPKYVPKKYIPSDRVPITRTIKVDNQVYTFEVLLPNDNILKVQPIVHDWAIGNIVQLDATTVALCINIQDVV